MKQTCHATATICQQPQRIATRGTLFATYSLGTLFLIKLKITFRSYRSEGVTGVQTNVMTDDND